MKINFTLFAAVAFFLGLAGCAEAQPSKITTFGAPMLTPNELEHNYGQVKKGADGNCTFELSNTGDQNLIISSCQGSCGCTTPKCDPNTTIEPGKTVAITVHYDTNRMGPFTKTVMVNWNNPEAKPTVLTIKGEVIE
jgi:hypothetical protein